MHWHGKLFKLFPSILSLHEVLIRKVRLSELQDWFFSSLTDQLIVWVLWLNRREIGSL